MKNKYYYLNEANVVLGPFTWAELIAKLKTQEISFTTLVAEEGTQAWFAMSDLLAQSNQSEHVSSQAHTSTTHNKVTYEYDYSMGVLETFKHCLRNYCTVSGRATRQEYWYWSLVCAIFNVLAFIAIVIGAAIGGEALSAAIGILYYVISLGILLPGTCVAIRRMHDVGKSGFILLVGLIPFGPIYLLYLCCQDSQQGSNKYGPSLKYPD